MATIISKIRKKLNALKSSKKTNKKEDIAKKNSLPTESKIANENFIITSKVGKDDISTNKVVRASFNKLSNDLLKKIFKLLIVWDGVSLYTLNKKVNSLVTMDSFSWGDGKRLDFDLKLSYLNSTFIHWKSQANEYIEIRIPKWIEGIIDRARSEKFERYGKNEWAPEIIEDCKLYLKNEAQFYEKYQLEIEKRQNFIKDYDKYILSLEKSQKIYKDFKLASIPNDLFEIFKVYADKVEHNQTRNVFISTLREVTQFKDTKKRSSDLTEQAFEQYVEEQSKRLNEIQKGLKNILL